jgi:SAM-dependent methyltransferase
MSSTLTQLRWSIQHRGLAGTVRSAANALKRRLIPQPPAPPHPFDVVHNTDTGGLIPGGALASGHASDRHIAGYAAVPPSRFRNMIARWQSSSPAHPLAEYSFIDLGCGKGRALLLASELGFREVIGVELNPSLAAIAQANANLWSAAGKASAPVRIEQQDALEFNWPAGRCLVFLFNPFGDELMRQVAARMAAAFRDRPSDLELLYYKPEQASAFAHNFETIWCEAIAISAQDLAVDPVAGPTDQTRAYRLIP